jgi:choline dehydrogenase-like flavoprotein
MTGRYPDAVDVAIVGSGPTGAAYARILSETAPGLRVAMFEVGPTVSEPAGAHVKNIVDPDIRAAAQRRSEGPGAGEATLNSPRAVAQGGRRARPGTFLLPDDSFATSGDGLPLAAMSSNVGGMGAHWTAACPRPGGSERIGFLDATGELDELLDEAERLSAAVDEGRIASSRVQRMPLAVHRGEDGGLLWSGADVVMGEATRQNPHFSLFEESLVTRVLTQNDGRDVAALEVRDRRTEESHRVRARFVVVAADALRTPQLLWASGIRLEALGRYLNDQSQVVFASRLTGIDDVETQEPEPTGGALSEWSGVSWVPFTDDLPFHGQIMQLDASPIPLADDDPVIPGSIVGLGFFCAKELSADDRLEFADDEVDTFGMPAIRVHYALSERDRAVIDRARQEIIRLGQAVGTPLDDQAIALPPGASLHLQGTTRMGESDDGTSVCDPTSAVWGVAGLYVAGNNVIPTSTACNPTLTSVALAVKGARSIADAS